MEQMFVRHHIWRKRRLFNKLGMYSSKLWNEAYQEMMQMQSIAFFEDDLVSRWQYHGGWVAGKEASFSPRWQYQLQNHYVRFREQKFIFNMITKSSTWCSIDKNIISFMQVSLPTTFSISNAMIKYIDLLTEKQKVQTNIAKCTGLVWSWKKSSLTQGVYEKKINIERSLWWVDILVSQGDHYMIQYIHFAQSK